LSLGALDFVHGFRLLQPTVMHGNIGKAPEKKRFRGQTVPPGAARLLIIGFNRARHAHMDHEPDIRLIHSHPERERSHHNTIRILKNLLLFSTGISLHTAVIGKSVKPLAPEPFRE
jgi:hypothetical protein